MRSRILVAFALALGCGGPPMRSGPLNPGQVDSEPSMECLPDPDVTDAAMTRRMRFGWTLAAESFVVPPPEAPDERNAQNLEAWGEEVLAPWLERKTHTVEAARRELDQAAEEDHRQRIMGGAIVGLMYEDVARVLRSIPPPEELADEPEIQEIYQQILRSQARPFLEHARRAYNACARNAIRPESMRHWSRFCAGRQDRLPEAESTGSEAANGETTVEIIAD
jgi:hypothetical protein